MFAGLWKFYDRKFCYKIRSRYSYFYILLLLCGDIEKCPGPDRVNPELQKVLSTKGMKIFHQNTRGLWVNFLNVTELLTNFCNIDILTLSETHVNKDEPGELFSIDGYSFIRKDRENE